MLVAGAALMAGGLTVVPVAPAKAAVVANQDAATFVQSVGEEAFAALKTGNKVAVRTKFREVLSQHFALDFIGDRLIKRWITQITPAQ